MRNDEVEPTPGLAPGPLGSEESLDPGDWGQVRQLGHRMVDDMVSYLATVRDRPAWRPVPPEVRQRLGGGVPHHGAGPEAVYGEFLRDVLPYPTGNIHPRFWGWVTGTGSAQGMLAELLAAGMNPMVAASESAPAHVEAQVLDWCRTLFGFPAEAGGLLVSGCSTANLLGLAVARSARADRGEGVFRKGVRGLAADPVLYCSDQTHNSVDKAAATLGLGTDCIRSIPSDQDFRIRIDLLEQAIAEDRAAGRRPFCVVGTAGTVLTGATDDLDALADTAERHGLWFHVDGAFGAWAALSPRLRPGLRGMERADSLAFDFHKWMYQPYDAAALLVRDRDAHRRTFSAQASYTAVAPRGTAAAEHPFNELGLELSRGFRALKIWFSLKADGLARYARLVEQNVAQARYLAALVEDHPALELLAPVPLNVVCLAYRGGLSADEADEANPEILMRLQERGIAVPTAGRIRGRFAIRCAIANHRSRREDFELLVREVASIGEEVEKERSSG